MEDLEQYEVYDFLIGSLPRMPLLQLLLVTTQAKTRFNLFSFWYCPRFKKGGPSNHQTHQLGWFP